MMFRRKTLLLTQMLAFSFLPLIAHADLITINHTGEYVVAAVLSVKTCSGPYPGGHTLPYKEGKALTAQVKALCNNKAPCSATIVLSKTYLDMLQCKGKAIGTAQIDDLETDIVKNVAIKNISYQILGEGTHEITINQVSAQGGKD